MPLAPELDLLAVLCLLLTGVLYHLMGRNLETGLPQPYTHQHWHEVVQQLGLSKHQVGLLPAPQPGSSSTRSSLAAAATEAARQQQHQKQPGSSSTRSSLAAAATEAAWQQQQQKQHGSSSNRSSQAAAAPEAARQQLQQAQEEATCRDHP